MIFVKYASTALIIFLFTSLMKVNAESLNSSLSGDDSVDICTIQDSSPSVIYNSSGFYQRRGKIEFGAKDGNILNAYTYRATSFNPDSGKVLFVFHGVSRNAADYLATFEAIAEKHGVFVVAPEFSSSVYPQSSDYTLGVHIGDSDIWRNKSDYIYSEIEHLFESTRSYLMTSACGYYAFGHSAGAQFLHRLNSFLPNNRMLRGVAANSGWYTLSSGLTEPSIKNTFPYGLNETPVTISDLRNSFSKNLVILVGEEDIGRDSNLNQSALADSQGINRYERGHYYFLDALRIANQRDLDFNWSLDTVPHAGHDKDEMAASASYYLFKSEQDNVCVTSVAHGNFELVVNEIHADPISTSEGDANNDGTRDGLDDEFIEIVNAGNQSVCLNGWTISDAKKVRHSFPVGTKLAPGETIVVFGGGTPMGAFGNSDVQTVMFSSTLSLSNSGDIITIRDGQNTVVKQLSWGNCANETCLGEYISLNLGKNQSVVRSPAIIGNWKLHREVDATKSRYSPGLY